MPIHSTQFPALPAGRVYLIIGPGVWGKSPEYDTAMKIARKENGGTLKKHIIYDAPSNAYIDDYGSTCWTPTDFNNEELTQAEAPREIARGGFNKKAS